MGLLLPCCAAFLLFDYLRRAFTTNDGRETLCLVALLLGIFVVCGTELLNAFHFLTPTGAYVLWTAGGFIALLPCISAVKQPALAWTSLRRLLVEADWLARGMVLVIFIFATVTGLVAWQAVPNNYDSMTYHLARVIHWRQDHSIAFFPTSIYRQNSAPPLAEWIILHLSLLQGDARAANMVQWCCYLGCIAGVSLLTERIGGTSRTGLIAAFFAATLPAAVLEATSTQNDLVMSFWLVCLALGCVILWRGPSWRGTFIVGAATGLGLLTKTVVLLYVFPFLIAAFFLLLRGGWRQSMARIALIGLLIVGLNLGHAARNEAISGSPLGPGSKRNSSFRSEVNMAHSPGIVFSNAIRNLGLHAVILDHSSFSEQVIARTHQLLGLDLNDPRSTSIFFKFFLGDMGENGCPMPAHLLAVLVAFAFVLARARREPSPALALTAAILAGAFLFCLVLRWEPFHSRLHLPLFVLSAPVVALILQRNVLRFALWPVFVIFIANTAPLVFANPQRPAVGAHSVFIASDEDQQYAGLPSLREPYVNVIRLLEEHHAREVGIVSYENDWEYPIAAYGNFHSLWRTDYVLLQDNVPLPAEIARHPDALVCTRYHFGNTIDLDGQSYRRIYMLPATHEPGSLPMVVYLRADSP